MTADPATPRTSWMPGWRQALDISWAQVAWTTDRTYPIIILAGRRRILGLPLPATVRIATPHDYGIAPEWIRQIAEACRPPAHGTGDLTIAPASYGIGLTVRSWRAHAMLRLRVGIDTPRSATLPWGTTIAAEYASLSCTHGQPLHLTLSGWMTRPRRLRPTKPEAAVRHVRCDEITGASDWLSELVDKHGHAVQAEARRMASVMAARDEAAAVPDTARK